jgi:type II secretory ATPase GspE/PulE/Tfp pilus assembly ATPase PilB-like protein
MVNTGGKTERLLFMPADSYKPKNSLPDANDVTNAIDFIIVSNGDDGGNGKSKHAPESTDKHEDLTIAPQTSLERRFNADRVAEYAHFLDKKYARRYRAIILNAWTDKMGSQHYEVGLVDLLNADDRDEVIHALRVSPLDVRFVSLDDAFFRHLFGELYSDQAQTLLLEHEHKKQSQRTKQWGDGKRTLSDDEARTVQATADADFVSESEEWLDLTDNEEYERNIRRSEAEMTTQEFIRLILMEFLRSGSSDMHIEAGQPTGRIRFRYDSEMFTRWDKIPFVKIKQLCMGMAETSGKDATQMKFKDIDSTVKVRALRDGKPVDIELRFASQPTLYAPSIVLRSQLKPIRDIYKVGFLPEQIADLKAAYSQKRGILTITGATGSGKTNTLEAIYAQLEAPDSSKIIEIGEPIEIRSSRRTQMSLRPNTPFTWWDAFYSCLRADPDIIGIGELRSADHVSLAINAALTGHLVLSTFHAASVEDTLSRMFQMGIPRENLATGLNLILAQALIKKLCEKCKIVDLQPSENYEREVYKSVGCPECFNKGPRGRTAIAELLYFNDEVKEWIQNRELSAREVVGKALAAGYLIPMKHVAREKVMSGITSELEVSAVLGLVESERQYANRAHREAADRVTADRLERQARVQIRTDYVEGEIVG